MKQEDLKLKWNMLFEISYTGWEIYVEISWVKIDLKRAIWNKECGICSELFPIDISCLKQENLKLKWNELFDLRNVGIVLIHPRWDVSFEVRKSKIDLKRAIWSKKCENCPNPFLTIWAFWSKVCENWNEICWLNEEMLELF